MLKLKEMLKRERIAHKDVIFYEVKFISKKTGMGYEYKMNGSEKVKGFMSWLKWTRKNFKKGAE